MHHQTKRFFTFLLLLLAVSLIGQSAEAQVEEDSTAPTAKSNVSGVFPGLAAVADHAPRTEAGIGALMPWADRLWFVTYVAHKDRTGSGTGLYEVDENLRLRKRPESVVGTYANRMIHSPSNQLIIGPHAIDTLGNVRTFEPLIDHRLAATMEHLTEPSDKVYFLGMEGEFFEADVHTLEVRELFNLMDQLDVPETAKPHFKDAFTAHGRVIVANNTYDERDFTDAWEAGRLAEWDGETWTVLAKEAFTEVWSPKSFGNAIYATGWDEASVILEVYADGEWSRYRLPKASHTFDGTSTTEWMRIREVETERALMDVHGMFYEMPYHSYTGKMWGLRPIATHLRVVPDFASWRGMLVLGGNQATPMWFGKSDRNLAAGQPQANLWFGKTDDLWQFGKPAGWGGPWRDEQVEARAASDPYLMTGFDKKVVHLRHDADEEVTFILEVDFLGDGSWVVYDEIIVPAEGYLHHEFPSGFSAHWVRVRVDTSASVTAYFVYT